MTDNPPESPPDADTESPSIANSESEAESNDPSTDAEREDTNSSEAHEDTATIPAAESLLSSLSAQGLDRIFANLGTDHTPLLETIARVRKKGEANGFPEVVTCPHEFVAMSAAHGHAAASGDPQAVLVHVDVGTQNLGAAVHNAHRAKVPLFVMAGLAPVTEVGHLGSRDNVVHYVQDVFDQPGIVREYCRWHDEYRPPADPSSLVARGLERAVAPPAGPTYLAATREALETSINPADPETSGREYRRVAPGAPDAETVADLTDLVGAADHPLVITGNFGREPGSERRVDTLVEFAETAGAGVVEQNPTTLCFPRDHDLHIGFEASAVLEHADLVLVTATDVPWVPSKGTPRDDTTVIQVDSDPTKATYPRWGYDVDHTVQAAPAETLRAVADALEPTDGEPGRGHWREVSQERRETVATTVSNHREDGDLTPEVLTDELAEFVDDSTIVVEDAVTNRGTVLKGVPLSEPGSFHGKGGSGLGFGAAAAVGVKMARPNNQVIATVGDGAYVFANPTATAWLAAAQDAPTLTVVYDNGNWQAVDASTVSQHPDGFVAAEGLPESSFDAPPMDLSAPASVVDTYTEQVTSLERLKGALADGIAAVEAGRPAVLDVKLE